MSARIQGARAGIASTMIKMGGVNPTGPSVDWFRDNGMVDAKTGELECELYWQAIRDGILKVIYVIKVDDGRPHFVLDHASVSTGLMASNRAIAMMEHAVALGLCADGPLKIEPMRGRYQVMAR
jgi:hypothetical protein